MNESHKKFYSYLISSYNYVYWCPLFINIQYRLFFEGDHVSLTVVHCMLPRGGYAHVK